MPRADYNFDQHYNPERKPPTVPPDGPQEKVCACGAAFTAFGRRQYRCPPCQQAAKERASQRANAKFLELRKKARG